MSKKQGGVVEAGVQISRKQLKDASVVSGRNDFVEVVVQIPRDQIKGATARAVGRLVPDHLLYQEVVPQIPDPTEEERLLLVAESRRGLLHDHNRQWVGDPRVKTIFARRRQVMDRVHLQEKSSGYGTETIQTICLLVAKFPQTPLTREDEVSPIPHLARYGEGRAMGHQYDGDRSALWATLVEKEVTCPDCLSVLEHARKKAAKDRGLPYRRLS